MLAVPNEESAPSSGCTQPRKHSTSTHHLPCINALNIVMSSLEQLTGLPWTEAHKDRFHNDTVAAAEIIDTNRIKYTESWDYYIRMLGLFGREESKEKRRSETEELLRITNNKLVLLFEFQTRLDELKNEVDKPETVPEDYERHYTQVCAADPKNAMNQAYLVPKTPEMSALAAVSSFHLIAVPFSQAEASKSKIATYEEHITQSRALASRLAAIKCSIKNVHDRIMGADIYNTPESEIESLLAVYDDLKDELAEYEMLAACAGLEAGPSSGAGAAAVLDGEELEADRPNPSSSPVSLKSDAPTPSASPVSFSDGRGRRRSSCVDSTRSSSQNSSAEATSSSGSVSVSPNGRGRRRSSSIKTKRSSNSVETTREQSAERSFLDSANTSQKYVKSLVDEVTNIVTDFHLLNGESSTFLMSKIRWNLDSCKKEEEFIDEQIEKMVFADGGDDEGNESGEALSKFCQAKEELVELMERMRKTRGAVRFLLPVSKARKSEVGTRRAAISLDSNTAPAWLGQDGYEQLTEEWIAQHEKKTSGEILHPTLISVESPRGLDIVLSPGHILGSVNSTDNASSLCDSRESISATLDELAAVATTVIYTYANALPSSAQIDSELTDIAREIVRYNAQEYKERTMCIGVIKSSQLPSVNKNASLKSIAAYQLQKYWSKTMSHASEIDEKLLKVLVSVLEESELRAAGIKKVGFEPLEIPIVTRRWSNCDCGGQDSHLISCPDYPMITDEEEVVEGSRSQLLQEEKNEEVRKSWQEWHEGTLLPAQEEVIVAVAAYTVKKPETEVVPFKVCYLAKMVQELAKGKVVHTKDTYNVLLEQIAEGDKSEDSNEVKTLIEALMEYYTLVWENMEQGVEVSEPIFKLVSKIVEEVRSTETS